MSGSRASRIVHDKLPKLDVAGSSPLAPQASRCVVLKVDNAEVASRQVPHTIPFLMSIDETFDVGVDTRTPVDDRDHQVPFRFNGKLDKLTVTLKPERTAAGEVGLPPKK